MSIGQIVWCVLMVITTVGFVAFWGVIMISIYRNTDPERIHKQAQAQRSPHADCTNC